MYASALARDPAATYRQIDVAGRSAPAPPPPPPPPRRPRAAPAPPGPAPALVQLLYEELLSALRGAGWAAEHGRQAVKSERVTRATAILFALEAGLDFVAGGQLSVTLATLYAGARRRVLDASLGGDPAPFREVADTLEGIAGAWRQARAA